VNQSSRRTEGYPAKASSAPRVVRMASENDRPSIRDKRTLTFKKSIWRHHHYAPKKGVKWHRH
jgi:hypothetical protein